MSYKLNSNGSVLESCQELATIALQAPLLRNRPHKSGPQNDTEWIRTTFTSRPHVAATC